MSEIHNCDNCKHEYKGILDEPCCYCTSSFICLLPYEKWEPKDSEEKGENHV